MWLSSKKIKKVSSPAKKFRVKNGWRLHQLFRIEQLLIDAGVKDRAKRMGMWNFKRNKTWFKKYLAGGVEHIEVAKHKERNWHIHSHILVDLKVNRKVEMSEVIKKVHAKPKEKIKEFRIIGIGMPPFYVPHLTK